MNPSCYKTKKIKEIPPSLLLFLKAISEETRLKILYILREKNFCVCDVWQQLELPQNLVSHHLKVLKGTGLIQAKKERTKVIYSLNEETIQNYINLLSKYI